MFMCFLLQDPKQEEIESCTLDHQSTMELMQRIILLQETVHRMRLVCGQIWSVALGCAGSVWLIDMSCGIVSCLCAGPACC